MDFLKALRAGAKGTSFMTLFSYGYSALMKKQYREPVLLSHLFDGPEGPSQPLSLAKGWAAHYLTGAVFATTYQLFLQGKFLRNPVGKGIICGGMYGLLGVSVWRAAFKAHPNPPQVSFKGYYRHLFIAHLIFGYFAFVKLERENKPEKGERIGDGN